MEPQEENCSANENSCAECQFEFDVSSEDSEELSYTCSTCNETKDGALKLQFCNYCIVSHVRKQHRVLDSKGYDISVCDQHKSIHELFCSYCNFALCRQCITGHRGHEIIPIREKCAETRKEVFKYMNDFDLLTKDVKFQQHVQKECLESLDDAVAFCRPETVVDVLISLIAEMVKDVASDEDVKSLISELSAKFDQDSKLTLTKAKSTEFDRVVTEADDIGLKLREVLQNSDGMLVNKFKAMVDQMDTSLKLQKDQVANVNFMQPFYVNNPQFRSDLKVVVRKFFKDVAWPTAKTVKPVIVGSERGPPITGNQRIVLFPFDVYCLVEMNHEVNERLVRIIKCGNKTALIPPRNCFECGRLLGQLSTIMYVCCQRSLAKGTDPYNLVSFVKLNKKSRKIDYKQSPKTLEKTVEIVYPIGMELKRSLGEFVAIYGDIFHIVNPFCDDTETHIHPKPLFDGEIVRNNFFVYYSLCISALNCLIYDNESKKLRPYLTDKTFQSYSCPEKPSAVTVSNDFKTLFAVLESTGEIFVFSSGRVCRFVFRVQKAFAAHLFVELLELWLRGKVGLTV